MEKLKPIHDHKLTDIVKVGIFALMLLLPFLVWLPSGLYYGFNEHAVTENETIEKYETKQVNFNQLMPDDKIHFTYSGNNPAFYDYTRLSLIGNHKYAFKFTPNTYPATPSGAYTFYLYNFSSGQSTIYQLQNEVYTITTDTTCDLGYATYNLDNNYYQYEGTINYFDLTQMFGSGNEPTISEFNSIYTKNYYNYTLSKLEIIDIPTGETTSYTNISNQLVYNWQNMWNSPLFYWTNVSILNTGLTNFSNVLGINTSSYITNLITYELIIVSIYIVLDIVLTLFKWLTHIGQKE